MNKVICPYCADTEMEPREMRLKNDMGIFKVQLICRKCSMCGPLVSGKTEEEAQGNAILAAKCFVQNSIPAMQKPLTWWEACEDDAFIEYKGREEIGAALLQGAFCTEGTIAECDYAMYSTHTENGIELFGLDYGLTWRAWAKRPTDAERAAAPWTEIITPEIPKETKSKAEILPAPAQAAAKTKERIRDNQITVGGWVENGGLTPTKTSSDGRTMYEGTINRRRPDGKVDKIPLVVPAEVYNASGVDAKIKVLARGQVRKYMETIDGCKFDVLKVYAETVENNLMQEDICDLQLEGVVCRMPDFQLLLNGGQVCNLMLEVDRGYGRMDYISCGVWDVGALIAREAKIGDWVRVEGRLDMREVKKTNAAGLVVKKNCARVNAYYIERE